MLGLYSKNFRRLSESLDKMSLKVPSSPASLDFRHIKRHKQVGIKASGSLNGRSHLGRVHLFETPLMLSKALNFFK